MLPCDRIYICRMTKRPDRFVQGRWQFDLAPSRERLAGRDPPSRGSYRRNSLASERYSPLHAAGAYLLRRQREGLIEKDQTLQSFVRDRLAEGWAPEQISGWLKAGNERRLRTVGCETIYGFIYRGRSTGAGTLALSHAAP